MTRPAETIGDRIRSLRGDVSQQDFATHMGVDKNTIGRYERGERQPDADFIVKLCAEFNKSADWLLTGFKPPHGWGDPDYSDGIDTAQDALNKLPAFHLDPELNARVIDGITRLYKDAGVHLSAMDLGRQAAKVYTDLADFDQDERPTALKAILGQMRRQLLEVPIDHTGTTKQVG